MAQAQADATQKHVEHIQAAEVAQIAVKAEAQYQINQEVVPKLVELTGQIAELALDEHTSLSRKMAAAEFLRRGVRDGWTIEPQIAEEAQIVQQLQAPETVDLLELLERGELALESGITLEPQHSEQPNPRTESPEDHGDELE